MLEHSAMYLNVTPPYEDDTSFFPDFYSTRLGPCELQDPVWAKMSALAAGVNKKRKKSETKPQAQINKCNNEKRRREQENIYIEELAELISANFADMSSLSVKPDKCAILQETVNQIRSIKQRENAAQSTDPVQQGEVSSSHPAILSNEVYGPLLLEALEGFLFVVNGEGKVEHVTENVSAYIKFTREDLFGKSVYNFIHHGDHHKFRKMLPLAIEWSAEQQQQQHQQHQSQQPNARSKSIDIRLLVKPSDELDETVEEKQQRISSYELMHISSTRLRDHVLDQEDGGDGGPCLLCVASRISHRDRTSCAIEQFSTKLDIGGKIVCVDTSGVSEALAQQIKNDLKGCALRDLVAPQEVHKINGHLRETVTAGQSTSPIYRLRIGADRYVQVKTKSKLFKTVPHATNDTDFIMATHSIIGENEPIGPSDPGGGVGGPLMTSVVNGNRNGGGGGGGPSSAVCSGSDSSTASSNALMSAANASSFAASFNLDSDFGFHFPTSTCWELEPTGWQTETAAAPVGRPDSRQSATPPRPPSNGTSYGGGNLYSNAFPFSPLGDQQPYQLDDQKDTKSNVLEEAALMAESNRLRNLLTQAKPAQEAANEVEKKDRILKELLNQPDEEARAGDSRASPRGMPARTAGGGGPPDQTKGAGSSSGNNMLRQLLNDKGDDDDLEAKAGMKKKSELLQQLLKTERDNEDEKKNDLQSQDDSLLRSLGFPPSSPTGRKRPNDDKDDHPSKRNPDGSQVSSSGPSTGSKLCERNKMLASLLAKQPTTLQPIPPLPASVISAVPQEKLPRITSDPNKTLQMGVLGNLQQLNTLNNNRNSVARMPGGRPQTNANYLSAVLAAQSNLQRNETRNQPISNQINSSVNCFTSPATSSTDNMNVWENNNLQTSNDPVLSDLLDQVIEFVPEDIMAMLDGSDGQQTNNFQTGLSETMAINIIQKSLMQCESAVKSPGSPISLPSTPPAYSSANITSGVFPPPPNYSQAKFQRLQNRAGTAPQYSANALSNHAALQHRKQHLLLQQEQKRRLLLQQKQQQLLIPINSANAEINSMQNIDTLLNSTVAPNVSLQRSSSVPEPQLSPNNYQQRTSANQQPYSPLGQQSFPQTTMGNYQNAAASRLSPQAQFGAQLSPRQTYPQSGNWQQQTQARLTVQQNPMLSAQLTRPPQQQQRSINSPGTVQARHSPYPTSDQFPPPNSPNSSFNSPYLSQRLQRTNSTPNTSAQLHGGLGSPRAYAGGREHHPHSYPQIPSHHNVPPMMYQQDTQYCYDQTGLPLPYNGADQRGRQPPHLQPSPGVSGSGPTSEFVKQELRAVVGARTGQGQPVANRPQASQVISQQQPVNDLETLGINFEMATGASDSPKLWCAMGSDMGSMSPQPATSRSSMEEGRQGDQKSSLLQKLLSE